MSRAAPARSISRIMASRLRITRSGGSLRTKIVIAVEAVICSSPRRCATDGSTVATGSRANRMMKKPMAAFQKPITDQGMVSPKKRRRRASAMPNPPAERA